MAENSRVAVYLDFDNIVISRYDHVFGTGTWRRDDARDHTAHEQSKDEIDRNLATARVDVGAILDYASSFGTVAQSRAYADWSVPANTSYRRQLVDRAVDLVQLFALGGTKNGADIRLSVDVMEDLIRYPDLTHVVLVAGDSDYVALAQRCKQLGRFVVGIGVAGSTGRALIAACDEFSDYDALPDVKPVSRKAAKQADAPTDPNDDAGALLVRALRIVAEKSDDEGWAHLSSVKQQMVRMDPGFKEKSLGFSSFRAFADSFPKKVELQQSGQAVRARVKG
ncbi:NYN domain-containing protein [Nocardioides acrostichi]|uniref:NYN domain-containing protein n=1 Tax=Nocardioides acrostichi TaxID=2784339 RepID=UPI002E2CA1F1|nr:NYN domain-containing protein [Nocardioides acrostichi]